MILGKFIYDKLEKTFSMSARDLFYPPVIERIKTRFARFRVKNIPYMGRGLFNRPFYSCCLSVLALSGSEAGGWRLVMIQTLELFRCKSI